jgi:hypothetical protein
MKWDLSSGLALYGAITGTLALAVTYFSHRHSLAKDKIKISVSWKPHPNQQHNIEAMLNTAEKEPWKQINLAEVFEVTVRNIGSITAPIEDVGVVTPRGRKSALVSASSGERSILMAAAQAPISDLEPKTSRTFSIYLGREEEIFTVRSAYAIDQLGKTWHSRA